MHRSFSIAVLSGVVGALIASQPAQAYTLVVEANGGITELSIDANPPFHNTEATVSNATLIEVAGSTLLVVHWTETTAGGGSRPFYTFSYDGTNFVEARPTSYVIKLRYEEFDPVPVENIPQVDASLLSASWADLFVVQFVSQPLTEYRQAIELLGATVRSFLPNNAQIVELAGATPAELMDLPYVRSVFEFHPAYRIDDYIRDNLDCPSPLCTSVRYNIMLFEDDLSVKAGVAAGIGTIGGTVAVMPYTGPVLQAMLTKDQLLTVIHWDEVAFVDLWAPSVPFMDKVRVISGANYLKGMEGFQGEGVRGEAADTYLQTTHRAFQNRAPIMHGGQDQGSASYHGTPVYGILFADDPEAPEDTEGPIRGMLPKAQGIFSDYQLLKDFLPGDGVSREVNICQLVAADSDEWLACCDAVYCDSACCSAYSWPGPDGEPCCSDPIPPGDASICDPECCSQYTWPGTGEPCCDTDDACRDLAYPAQDVRLEAVFQSNSGGTQPSNGPSAYGYAVVPAEIDRILDTYDIIRCQAQGNDSTAAWNSALEAWAKNGVSVGGVRHVNRLDPDTHLWSLASYGPAPDGRIKPDLTHFIDQVYAPCWSGDSCNEGQYKNNFAGTSAATPIVCGHFGLFFQMWHLGIFTVCDGEGSNCIASGGPESVFASRPGLATSKAMLINTASPYRFFGPDPPNFNVTRDKQGWGLPSVQKLHSLAVHDQFPLIIPETRALNFNAPGSDIATYDVDLEPGTSIVKVTLVYTDPAGAVFSAVNAVNDLNLKVTVPGVSPQPDTVYLGNCGLIDSNWSTAKSGCTNGPETGICCSPNQQYASDAPRKVVDTVENVFILLANPLPALETWKIEVTAAEIEPSGATVYFALVVSADFDCNDNDYGDSRDLALGTSADCNSNAIPDECDPDCNANGVPDDCDVDPLDPDGDGQVSADCNENGIPDSCDVDTSDPDGDGYVALDCGLAGGETGNGIPDECESDCDQDDVVDYCEAPPRLPSPPRLPTAADHLARKHRYLSIWNDCGYVGLKVTLSSMKRCSLLLSRACKVDADCHAAVPGSGTCVEHPDVGTAGPWWVQAPQQEQLGCIPGPCVGTDWFARVWTTPHYQKWESDMVHIGDCEIIPVAMYEIRACLPPDLTVCSEPLTIGTIEQPFVAPGFRGNYGDVVGLVDPITGQFAPPDGFTNIVDVSGYILTQQNYGTANKPQTHPTWVDLHGLSGQDDHGNPPQYILNVSDLGQILKALVGDAWTDDPGNRTPGQCQQVTSSVVQPNPGGPPVTFTLVADSDLIYPAPGQPVSVKVDVYIDSVADLGAYEVGLEVTGGTAGELLLQEAKIEKFCAGGADNGNPCTTAGDCTAPGTCDPRSDYVFAQYAAYDARSLTNKQLSNAKASGGVSVQGQGYLATYTFQPSEGASGVFTIAVKDNYDQTFLNDSNGVLLASQGQQTEVIGVGVDCLSDEHCGQIACRTGTCTDYACVYGNSPQGTPCDDGQFCTATDECDGNGACVGSGATCGSRQQCCQLPPRCVCLTCSCLPE